jgi:hypothetical protein
VDDPPRPAVAFYLASDARYFVGTVALLNSLRLVGHDEPVLVLDCGLAPDQRALIEREATVVPAPDARAATLLKAILPLQQPADVMVLLDTDVIVVRPLDELVGLARRGQVVAFPDVLHRDRHFPEWETIFGVGAPRRQPYLNAGHVLVPHGRGRPLLEEFETLQRQLDPGATLLGDGRFEDPVFFADMDVLNALLATRIPAEGLAILDGGEVAYTPFRGLRVADEHKLELDGGSPYLLHHVFEKPWLEPTRPNVYAQLLRRLLFRDDLALRLRPEDVPKRIRPGLRGGLTRGWAGARLALHDRLRGRLGVRRRIEERQQARLESR